MKYSCRSRIKECIGLLAYLLKMLKISSKPFEFCVFMFQPFEITTNILTALRLYIPYFSNSQLDLWAPPGTLCCTAGTMRPFEMEQGDAFLTSFSNLKRLSSLI